ncbi:hypothetical protein QO034_15160 [Sedimentitalea sp. JM2-8]|uniref:Uncharacterized protein n=1 Tax=Sedimentitalea xiamensis TaxID=3050037 RepID=A0ABT7FH43_9RHOB|nr:hypothetical protein [Sedimentitalea xiamensis]MDK3074438.1 hypothetical protein [Sedimentitalea xiamensis]
MTIEDLKKKAENLERMIVSAGPADRLTLQPQFSKVLYKLKAEGEDVPMRMRRLDAVLVEEAIEERFDNLPV